MNKNTHLEQRSKKLVNAFLALLALTPMVMPWFLALRPELDMTIGLLTGLLLMCCYFFCTTGITKSQSFTIVIHHSPLVNGVYFLWLLGLFSGFWIVNQFEWLQKIIYLLPALLVMFLSQQLLTNTQRLFSMCHWLFYSGVIVAVIGILQHLFGLEGFRQAVSPAASFGNKNMACHYLILTWPLGLVLFLSSLNNRQHYLSAIGMALIFTFLIYTQTRAAWLSVFIQMLLVIVFFIITPLKQHYSACFNGKKNKILTGLVLCFITVMYAGSFGSNAQSKLHIGKTIQSIFSESLINSPSANSRWALYFNSLLIIKDNPLLGVGWGHWKIYYPKYQQQWIIDKLSTEHNQPLKAHNDFIELTSELGIIGLIVILIMLWVATKNVWFLLQQKQLNIQLLTLGSSTALIGIIVNAQFSFPFQLPVPLTLLALHLNTIATLVKIDTPPLKTIPHYVTKIMATVCTILLIACCTLFYAWINSEKAWQKALVAEDKLAFHALIKHAKSSIQWLPWRTEGHYFIAFALQHLGEHRQALSIYQQLLQEFPNSSSALLRASQSAMLSNQPSIAILLLNQLEQNRPHSAIAQKHQGLLQLNYLKKPSIAAKYFKKALELDPDIEQAKQLQLIVKKYLHAP